MLLSLITSNVTYQLLQVFEAVRFYLLIVETSQLQVLIKSSDGGGTMHVWEKNCCSLIKIYFLMKI